MFRLILTLLCLTVELSYAEELLIPKEFIDSNNQVCTEYNEGYSSCSLDWYEQHRFGYSCTELAHPLTSPEIKKPVPTKVCSKYLPKSAFAIPKLSGKNLPNCSQVLLSNQNCGLELTRTGMAWACKKFPKSIKGDYPFPICTKDLKGDDVNISTLNQIYKDHQKEQHLKQQKKLAAEKAEYDSQKICFEYESQCYKHFPLIFPEQTNQNIPSYKGSSTPKYGLINSSEMKKCRLKYKNKKLGKSCTKEIERRELPQISFNRGLDWLKRHQINFKDNCVKYENKCFAYFLHLNSTNNRYDWFWRPYQKSCRLDTSKEESRKAMQCTSFFKGDLI